MALKDNWIDRQNGADDVDAEDINKVARAVIEVEKQLDDVKSLITGNNEALLWYVIRLNVKGSTGITLTTLPDSITEIPDNEFENLENVALTTLPSGLTKIGAYAFKNCISLNLSNWYMNKIASIGDYAFQGANTISIGSFNNKGVDIGKHAFSGANVSINNDLDVGNGTIGGYAFKNCTSIGEVYYITAGVIGTSAFEGCTNLAVLEYYGKEISATEIGTSAFSGCTSLTDIVFGEKLDKLKSNGSRAGAFKGCTGLTTVTFKGKPTTIGSGVFTGCTNLTDIYVSWAEGEVANAPFGATNATIHYNYTGE